LTLNPNPARLKDFQSYLDMMKDLLGVQHHSLFGQTRVHSLCCRNAWRVSNTNLVPIDDWLATCKRMSKGMRLSFFFTPKSGREYLN